MAELLAFIGVALLVIVTRQAAGGGRQWLRQGLLSNLANPKMAVFFSSLLPQFADSFAGLLSLGLVFCALTMVWLTGYATLVARAGDVLRRPRVRRTLDALTGTVLVGLGLRLATTAR
jgi:threonine/homoserine/homoserine lactone efflux protein